MQVGMTKDQGLYNKPSVAVHPGALAAGNLLQYNMYVVIISLTYVTSVVHFKLLDFNVLMTLNEEYPKN